MSRQVYLKGTKKRGQQRSTAIWQYDGRVVFDSSRNASLDHVALGPQNLVPSKGCAHKSGENWDELRADCNHQNAMSLKEDSFVQWWITQERTIIDPHPFLELDTAEQKVKAVLDLMEWSGHHDGESHQT